MKPIQVGVWLSLARALRSGRRGRRFKSSHPDHFFLQKDGQRSRQASLRAATAALLLKNEVFSSHLHMSGFCLEVDHKLDLTPRKMCFMAAEIPNLVKRNGIYYFRCRIPSILTNGRARESEDFRATEKSSASPLRRAKRRLDG